MQRDTSIGRRLSGSKISLIDDRHLILGAGGAVNKRKNNTINRTMFPTILGTLNVHPRSKIQMDVDA